MNEKLSRPQFNQMETTEKQALMESLAARYDMTFLGLHTGARAAPPAYSRKTAGSLSLSPAIPSPWAGNGSPLGWIRTAERNWTICSRNGRWSVILRR